MKIKTKMMISFIIIVLVLLFFVPLCYAEDFYVWKTIKKGTGSVSEAAPILLEYGWSSGLQPVATSGTSQGGITKYQWTYLGEEYQLEVRAGVATGVEWLLNRKVKNSKKDDIETSTYKTDLGYGDASYIFDKGGKALQILRNIAAIISVATITIIGIRYMTGSVEQKAEYKQTMMPVVIACMFISSLSAILTVIQSIFK